MKNLLGKARSINDPYAVFRRGDWTWKLLKAYKSPQSEEKDPHARWFVGAKSPATFGSYELGDDYKKSILDQNPLLISSSEAFKKSYPELVKDPISVTGVGSVQLLRGMGMRVFTEEDL